jgi:hypothetical protein
MDARERWQALQARLTAARAAIENGDRTAALSEIMAALALDKDFLAAQALRDRIVSMPDPVVPVAPPAPARPAVPAAPVQPVVFSPLAGSEPSAAPAGYAKFEQRAKRRRVDRRIDAARIALEQQRLKAAAAALDEVIELDPNLPELAELTARFDELRRATATHHRGPWIAAAVVFAGALLGGSWLQDSAPILSRQTVSAAPLPEPLMPIVPISEPLPVAGTTGENARAELPAPAPTPTRTVAGLRAPDSPAAVSPNSLRVVPLPVETASPPVRVADTAHVAPEPAAIVPVSAPAAPASASVSAPVSAPVAAPIPPSVAMPDDRGLIRETLQRYRSAYDGLDARSAQAVWPAVNEAALARAFDGLASQSLTFDACDVRLRGEAATATCHGSARYVTKLGNRDPRVEPRVWNFTLRKTGGDWKIDSARAER